MSHTITRIPLISGQQNKISGSFDIESLLSFISEAAFVVHRSSGRILGSNEKFITLAHMNAGKLKKHTFKDLFSVDIEKYLGARDKFEAVLVNEKQKRINVGISIVSLDENDEHLIMKIVPLAHRSGKDGYHDWEQKTGQILELSKLIDAPDVNEALENAIEIARKFLNADFVAIYKAENDYPGLTKLISTETDIQIPDMLPTNDFIKLSNTSLWLPGKRVVNELHRFAKNINMQFLISTPLGQERAHFGLLVAGSYQENPVKGIMKAVEILGVQISNTISHFILKTNLNRRLQDGNFLLSIRNILAENIREGIFVLTPDLLVREINPAAEIMLGYTGKEVDGQPIDNILIGADLLPQVFDAARNGITTHDIGNVYLHHRNGQSFPVHIQVIPVMVEDDVRAILTIVSDMSEREQIQLRTRQLEHRALLGEFASVFAHEVRNPINNISTGLQLLSSRFSQDDPNQEVIERTQNDCVRLNHLMESFLSFSRPIDHSSFDRVDINQLIKRVMDRWQPRLNRVNIKPLFQQEEEEPKIYGDAKSLERVFINLISNAVDVMSEDGGTLAIRIRLDNSMMNAPQIEITVTDSGPGIPDEIKNKIFEPFVTTKSQGTGLGLAITKHILTEHRGSICVKTFTGGTVFHVYLPAIIGA